MWLISDCFQRRSMVINPLRYRKYTTTKVDQISNFSRQQSISWDTSWCEGNYLFLPFCTNNFFQCKPEGHSLLLSWTHLAFPRRHYESSIPTNPFTFLLTHHIISIYRADVHSHLLKFAIANWFFNYRISIHFSGKRLNSQKSQTIDP